MPSPSEGAKVDESLIRKTIYVDPANAEAADDAKHGSQEEPLATLAFACRVAADAKDQNVGVRIILAPGVYREAAEVRPPAGARTDTDAPLVIEALERDQTIIDGADAEGWTASTWRADRPPFWTHPWPFQRAAPLPRTAHVPAPVTAPAETYRRGDLIFVNGNPLRQVQAGADLAPGTFWLPDGSLPGSSSADAIKAANRRSSAAVASRPASSPALPGPGSVIVQPPPDTDLPNALIQTCRREHGLAISDRRNVVVRGLMFQHAASPEGRGGADVTTAGLVLTGCSNVLVEDVLSQWNDGVGLVVSGRLNPPFSSRITLHRVRLLHNGGSGLYASAVKDLLVEDCETSFNNFRGEWAGWIDPAGQAGAKLLSVHGSTWRRHRAEGNACRGLWWTGDCADLLVEEAVIRNNLVSGLLIQNCPGPVQILRSEIEVNRVPKGIRDEAALPAGISISATPDVTLESNVIAGNAMPQLNLWSVADASTPLNFETKAAPALRSTGHTYHHNVFYGYAADQPMLNLPIGDRVGKGDFGWYYGTLDADENLYWNSVLPAAFCTYDRSNYHRPGLTLAGWQTFLLAHANAADGSSNARTPEANSFWQDPQFVNGPEGDFRLRGNSPVSGWNLPAEEGASE